MPAPQKSYRTLLQEEYDKRRLSNKRYSMRAFAQHLGLSGSRLSQILNGSDGLSRDKATHICDKLGFSDGQRTFFCTSVSALHARNRTERLLAQANLRRPSQDIKTLQQDTLEALTSWRHLVLVELVSLKGFKNDPTWIAQKLGMTESEVLEALQKLKKIGFLVKKKRGWAAAAPFSSTPPEIPSDKIKNFHRELIQKASQSLDTHSSPEREITSTLLGVDAADIPRAKTFIRDFQRRFIEEFGTSPSPSTVYALNIQLFDTLENV